MSGSRSLLSEWQLRPKKQLGQHFLADPSIAKMILARTGLGADDVLLEVGAGLGALTIPSAQSVRRVYAVEKDPDLVRALDSELKKKQIHNVVILNKSIFEVDIRSIAEKDHTRLVVMGNLPYNISSQVLFYIMEVRNFIDRAVFMFQKEFAHRLLAVPCTKDYGRLSVMLQYAAEIKQIVSVAAHLFVPRPKVDSVVLEISFRKTIENPVQDEHVLSAIVKAAFGKRRKTLKNALADSGLKMPGDLIGRILEASGIAPERRAETLTVSEFVQLTNCFLKFSTG